MANPWAQDCPQAPLGVLMSHECVFAELGIPEDWHRLTHDADFRVEVARQYNDLSERIVGRRLLSEAKPDPRLACPEIKGLHDIFEARNVWQNGSYWLESAASTEDELSALLDRVEGRLARLREFLLPPDWAEAKGRLTAAGGKVPLYRGQRGPVTFAMSVYGVENLIGLLVDNPSLGGRFRDLILRAMLERARILDEEAGYTPATAPGGFYWCDDNCALLNAELYEFFGYPILKGIFERYSSHPGDCRGQHSDSAMGHLLPMLGRLEMTTVNFGPTLRLDEIRSHLPKATIYGQLAPFVFSRDESVHMVAEFLRDLEQASEKRGWVFATAGSINNGSRLTGLRLIQSAIQEFGRY